MDDIIENENILKKKIYFIKKILII